MEKAKRKTGTVILFILFAIYLIALCRITIFRDSNPEARNVNLIPFFTIAEYLQFIFGGNRITGIANIFGNIIIFLPLGYISALLFPKMRKLTRILLLSFVFSLVIEVLQYIFACGSADIDDVILNILGGLGGYWFYTITSRVMKPKKFALVISASMIAVTCISFLAVNNYKFLINRPARGEMLTFDGQSDEGFYTDVTTDSESNVFESAWYLILVNKWNCVPDDYAAELTELSNGQSVDTRIYPQLQEMFDAARSENVYPVVASGYRTAEQQQIIMDEKIAAYKAEGYTDEEAVAKAEAWVALPGTSEHQLGIAVDINADGIHSAGYEVYEWLNRNAFRFGFICRYPPDKTEITGVINEPWHYRYVGVEAAEEIQNQGICLEEYLNIIN